MYPSHGLPHLDRAPHAGFVNYAPEVNITLELVGHLELQDSKSFVKLAAFDPNKHCVRLALSTRLNDVQLGRWVLITRIVERNEPCWPATSEI
jgi:hypothetical protein